MVRRGPETWSQERRWAWAWLENVVQVPKLRRWSSDLAELDGKPCFALNNAAFADFADEADRSANFTPILPFENR